MSTNPADTFLTGGGVPSAFGKDDPIGTTVSGVICDPAPTVKQQTDIQSGAGLTWDNGDPKMQLVVTIQTTQRDPNVSDDDGRRAVYVKGSKTQGSRSLHDAVATAVRAAGAKGLAIGGTLTVQLVGTEPSKTRGFNDRKLWAASYVAPDPAAVSASFLGAGPVATVPPAAPPVAPPAYAPPMIPAGYAPPVMAPAPAPMPVPVPQAATAAPAAAVGMSPEQQAAFAAWQASQQQPA
jgi:hypothetical protein